MWRNELATCPGIYNSMLMLNYVWILFDRTEESRIHKGLVRKLHFRNLHLLFSDIIISLSWIRVLVFMVRSCMRRVWWEWRTAVFLLICWRLNPSWRFRRWTHSLPSSALIPFLCCIHSLLFAASRTWWRSWHYARAMIWWVFTDNLPT